MASEMNYKQLRDFLSSGMRLSHIYQPLLIKSLIESGGTATIRQLASIFLSQDESQIRYYENRLKEMPVKVLSKHGIITKEGDLIKLNVKKLTFVEKAELKRLCEEKLQSYIADRGLAIWDYRLLDTEPVPDSLRYRVLKDSGGRCVLCGATKKESPLDVDHIVPRSKGGKTEYKNLQVLCAKCHRSKGNKDKTDFRGNLAPEKVLGCIFCEAAQNRKILVENKHCIAFLDSYPVTKGHTLIVPKRHVKDYFELSELERSAASDLLRIRRIELLELDSSIKGFNVGVNCGEPSGQTIEHCHIHLIPRREGDTPHPQGGVRGVIPDKMHYDQTT
jgi:diadenosine tetraphosphate (Ap4A) HIT family hydrolase